MKGCRRLERGCPDPEPEPPMPTRCVDRMNAEIRFHTDILNPKMVKCRKGLEERDVTGAAHFLAQLQKGLHLHHRSTALAAHVEFTH